MWRNDVKIKQHTRVTYLQCILDKTQSGEYMAIKAMSKIGGRLLFIHRKQSFVTPTIRRLFCIQPHFDYACITSYETLNKKIVNKV